MYIRIWCVCLGPSLVDIGLTGFITEGLDIEIKDGPFRMRIDILKKRTGVLLAGQIQQLGSTFIDGEV